MKRKKLLAVMLAAVIVTPTVSSGVLHAEEKATEALTESITEEQLESAQSNAAESQISEGEAAETEMASTEESTEIALPEESIGAEIAPKEGEKKTETALTGVETEIETVSTGVEKEPEITLTEESINAETVPIEEGTGTDTASTEECAKAEIISTEESAETELMSELITESITEMATEEISVSADSDFGFDFTVTDLGHAIKGQYFEYNLRDEDKEDVESFVIIDGNLPEGIAFDREGILSGTPGSVGDYEFVIRENYKDGTYRQELCSIVIIDEISVIVQLKEGKKYLPYSTGIIEFEPGWSSITKSNWLQFEAYTDNTCSLSGTPTEVGTYEVVFTYFEEDNGVPYSGKDIVYKVTILDLNEDDINQQNGDKSVTLNGEDDNNYYFTFELGLKMTALVGTPGTSVKVSIKGTEIVGSQVSKTEDGCIRIAIPKEECEDGKLEEGDTIVLNIKNEEKGIDDYTVYQYKINIKEPETETETETQRQTETETQRQTETETQRQTETETQRQTETETQRQTETETQRQTETETQRQTETETQRQTETETQRQTETETQAEVETQKQSAESQSETVVESENTETEAPKTGDTSNIALWLILMIGAVETEIFGAVLRRNKAE